MGTDLNVATRRLLQVVLDMLTNPDFEQLMKERAQAALAGEKVYGLPPRYRTDLLALWRAPRDPGPGDVIRQLDAAIADEVAMPWQRKGRR